MWQQCLEKFGPDATKNDKKVISLKDNTPKQLIILERNNGYYGGYEKRNNEYEQVFNINQSLLFSSIKEYINKGYQLICLDKSQETEFMKNRTVLI